MTTALIVVPKLTGKRKQPETVLELTPEETTEKKHKCVSIHPLVERKFTENIGDICWPLLNSSKVTEWSVREADNGWLLHIGKIAGITTKELLDSILAKIHFQYEIHQVVYGLALKFMDVRFGIVKPKDRRTGILSNVLKLDYCDVPDGILDKAHDKLKTVVDVNDFRLISRLISHAENVCRENTPATLKMEVETPKGFIVGCNNEPPVESKTTRSNYQFTVQGYDELAKAEFDSFAHILPFHAHSPSLDWDRGVLSVQLEAYERPRAGHPVDLYMDMA